MHAQIDSLIMKDLKAFKIPFIGLKLGSHQFEYHIDKTFFEAFNFDEYEDADINLQVTLVKKTTLLEIVFSITGTVHVPCDITLEPYDQELQGSMNLIVKFGPEYNDDHEEILILPHEAYQVDISQYVYELIVLSVPAKRVHPKVLDGTMNSETLQKLKDLSIQTENKQAEEADPRWDKLKDLLTEKKT